MTVISQAERAKYQRMWSVDQYADFSPGEQWMPVFLDLVGDERGTLLDAGCGTGRAGAQLAERGFRVTLMDLTSDALSHEVADRGLMHLEHALWRPCPGTQHERYDVGYCCDVLEHIPPEYTMLVIRNLVDACKRVFLTIATEPDAFGARIGEPLHLTVHPFVWWRDRIREVATVLDARDCGNTAVFWVTTRVA